MLYMHFLLSLAINRVFNYCTTFSSLAAGIVRFTERAQCIVGGILQILLLKINVFLTA